MKPSLLNIPSRDLLAADTITLERQRVRDRALDEEYFIRELAPGCVIYDAGGADAISSTGCVMSLPATLAGTNPFLHSSVLLRQLWPRTRPRLTLYYTAPGASTNAFNLRFQCRHYPVGGLVGGALLFSTILTPPGPAVANTVLQATIVGGAVIPSIAAPVRFSVGRIGGDTNPNSADILLAVVTMEEVA